MGHHNKSHIRLSSEEVLFFSIEQDDILLRANRIRASLKKTPIKARKKADDGELILVSRLISMGLI